MSKDRFDFFVIQNGEGSEVHDTDHGNSRTHSNPHAHSFENGTYGKPRDLNSNERYAKESFDTEDENGNPK